MTTIPPKESSIEKELKEAYQRLKETQTLLIQAEKMTTVGSIATGLAHEVKNPLATILYGIEFLLTQTRDQKEEVREALQTMREAAKKADQAIRDLLDFSSLSVFQVNDENINDVLKQALKLLHPQCQYKRIQVMIEYGKNIPLLRMDRNRVEQVMVNVILNAIEAMNEGGILKIRTSLEEVSDENFKWAEGQPSQSLKLGEKVVIVDFEDNGPGIAKDLMSHIFEPFFTTRRGSGGVGLGLSIARTIMHSHHGFINLDNLPQQGTRARLIFRLP
ncbi:MAG: ATP-binding protein [Candidatus Omnitrophica bacterium]|nr:ATP-binding protein [Candidatus Omnitrophota bacterium]